MWGEELLRTSRVIMLLELSIPIPTLVSVISIMLLRTSTQTLSRSIDHNDIPRKICRINWNRTIFRGRFSCLKGLSCCLEHFVVLAVCVMHSGVTHDTSYDNHPLTWFMPWPVFSLACWTTVGCLNHGIGQWHIHNFNGYTPCDKLRNVWTARPWSPQLYILSGYTLSRQPSWPRDFHPPSSIQPAPSKDLELAKDNHAPLPVRWTPVAHC